MSAITTRSRARLVAWLVFAAVGVGMGTVWATGFASVGGQTPNPASTGSTALVHTPGVADSSSLATKVTPGTGFASRVTWDGLYGATAATSFFKVDLTGLSGNYNVSMLLSNGAAMANAGWVSLQMRVGYLTDPAGGCSNADFAGALSDPQVITFDNEDAGAYWSGLAGNHVYCLGMNSLTPPSTDGYTLDPNDTFLRRSSTAGPSHYPEFIATVDRGA
jgi:hypothetical protein